MCVYTHILSMYQYVCQSNEATNLKCNCLESKKSNGKPYCAASPNQLKADKNKEENTKINNEVKPIFKYTISIPR